MVVLVVRMRRHTLESISMGRRGVVRAAPAVAVVILTEFRESVLRHGFIGGEAR